jgi:hypothetical protein
VPEHGGTARKSDDGVTFPIRRTALIDAIPLANKQLKPYEND